MEKIVTKRAFTLAETLITLVVIGIVAMITVPSLMQTHQNYVFTSALKKNFSVLSNAFSMAKKFDYNDYEDWTHADSNTQALYENYLYIRQYLNVVRECKDKEGCWSEDITLAPNGDVAMSATTKGIGGNIVTFTLSDGTNVCLDYWSQSDIISNFGVDENLSGTPLSVWVDVNGNKKPNKLGKDVFSFVLTTRGLVPAGSSNGSENCTSTGYDCAAKHIIKF